MAARVQQGPAAPSKLGSNPKPSRARPIPLSHSEPKVRGTRTALAPGTSLRIRTCQTWAKLVAKKGRAVRSWRSALLWYCWCRGCQPQGLQLGYNRGYNRAMGRFEGAHGSVKRHCSWWCSQEHDNGVDQGWHFSSSLLALRNYREKTCSTKQVSSKTKLNPFSAKLVTVSLLSVNSH